MESVEKKNKKSLNAEERASEENARLVFEYIFANEQIIKTSAQILADAIMLAHQMGDQCWSLTLFPDRIQLNVGPVEVLAFIYDEIFLVLDGSHHSDLVKSGLSPYITPAGILYRSVPGEQVQCYLPAEKLDDLYPTIAEQHRTFIQMAAKRRKKSTWHASFSPGVILYLNRLLGISLPVPAYFFGNLENEMLSPDTATNSLSVWLPAEEADQPGANDDSNYNPQEGDRRQVVERQIRERRGQQYFRNILRERYGDRCLVTGCEVLAVLEAAHIKPYRGEDDNHPENGLLLRADIHTLFDLDLLGLEPVRLRVELHPDLTKEKEYGHLAGKTLGCPPDRRPSLEALRLRYEQFQERVHRPI